MFKIIVASYNCMDQLPACLHSIEVQTCEDYEVVVIDDGSPGERQAALVDQWAGREGRRKAILHEENKGALFSQVEGVRSLNPNDDDIIVYLDGDDRFHDNEVLETVAWYYKAYTPLLTYGSYRSVPHDPGCPPAKPYDRRCIATNDYRNAPKWGICFNHLRTVKFGCYKHLTQTDFTEADGETFFHVAGDTAVMIPCLELAGERHRYIPEILVDYTSNSSQADWRLNAQEINRIHKRIFTELPRKEPL